MTNTWVAGVLVVTIAAGVGGFSAVAGAEELYSNDLALVGLCRHFEIISSLNAAAS